MKKKLFTFLLLFVFAAVFLMGKISAANGPCEEYAYLSFSIGDDSYIIYDGEDGTNNNALAGATYDLATNTLTIENIKADYLWAESMGKILN